MDFYNPFQIIIIHEIKKKDSFSNYKNAKDRA